LKHFSIYSLLILIVKNIEKLEELSFVKWESSIVIQKFLSIFGLPNEENVAISNFKKPKKKYLAIKKSHKKHWFLAFSFYLKKFVTVLATNVSLPLSPENIIIKNKK